MGLHHVIQKGPPPLLPNALYHTSDSLNVCYPTR